LVEGRAAKPGDLGNATETETRLSLTRLAVAYRHLGIGEVAEWLKAAVC
jgi:hypothetical protein